MRLIYVTPFAWVRLNVDELVTTCTAAKAGGASGVQLRDDARQEEFIEAVRAIRASVDDWPIIVNGALEDAVKARADGLHLKERALDKATVTKAKQALEFVGCSAHSVDSALRAVDAGVDYVQIGTMFPTQTHPDKLHVEGPALMADARAAVGTDPLLIGVGGVDATNCADVLRAGADGVAVIRALAHRGARESAEAIRSAMLLA